MSMQKRAFASTSSGQPSQLKRPRAAPMSRVWHQSKRNLMLRSWLTKEDVRTVVREEWERAKSDLAEYFQRANAESTANNNGRNLLLQFRTKLSLPLFTGKKLEGEGGACISVALIDVNTGDVVTSGPESSIKLDIVVLEGDFNKEDEDYWAQEEFEKYMVKEREGKRPLLTGDLQVKLKGGVGELGNLTFTDNSSWNKSKRFRIGLKVASDYCGDTRIREAKTDAFPVKEHRGEANKKSYPPKPDDEVWRLEKIAKDGKSHKKLSEARIHKVEDFVLQLIMHPLKLRQILGKSIIPKNWDSLILHARHCKINRKLYLYYMDSMRKDGALFDADDQLVGLIIDRVYVATHQLSAQEKEHGDSLVKKAFDNWSDVREFNEETFTGSMQKKSPISFPSQVSEGQIENLTPVQCNLAPQICATPGDLEAPLANVHLTAEGQPQNTNFGIAMDFTVDESVLLAAHQPISADQNASFGNAMDISIDKGIPLASHQPISADQNANFGNATMFSVDQPIPADNLNVLFSPGLNNITMVGLPNQSHDINLPYAMGSPMTSTIHELTLPYEPYTPIASFQYISTRPLPEGNPVMQSFQLTMADDRMDFLLAGDDDMSFQTPLWG